MDLNRTIALDREGFSRAPDSDDLIIPMAFASEEPYERWWGIEVLDCKEGSVRLNRLNTGAALLYNHNHNDLRGTHVPGSVKCEDGVLRGKVRITAATAAGRDAIALVDSDVLTKASVGYSIHKVIEETTVKGVKKSRELDGSAFGQILTRAKQEFPGNRAQFRRELDRKFGTFTRGEDEPTVYRVVDWEPFENSLVTIPADDTVGVGRMAEAVSHSTVAPPPKGTSIERSKTMTVQVEENAPAGAAAEQVAAQQMQQMTAAQIEKARCAELVRLGERYNVEQRTIMKWINSETSIDEAGQDIVKIMEERSKDGTGSDAYLGMSPNEVQRFSITRAIEAAYSQNWTKAGLELEAHRSIANRLNVVPDPKKIYIPVDIQRRRVNPNAALMRAEQIGLPGYAMQRDLTVASASGGGYLVSTDNVGFIDLYRAISVCKRMGARTLGGLKGNVTVPRQTAGATAYWLSTEATTITESQQTLGQLALSPKNVGAYTEISRQLLLQSSPDAEDMVAVDLAQVVALAVDQAGLVGSGSSGQPTGITLTSGIGSVTGTTFDFADILEFQTDVAAANVQPLRGGYVTTPTVAALAMQRVKFSSTASPLWEGNVWGGNMCGFPALASTQAGSGDCIFGDWDKLVIAEWGVLEIDINQVANFAAGIIGVRAMYTVDVGVRYPAAFSFADAMT